jgi:hypothetical protein
MIYQQDTVRQYLLVKQRVEHVVESIKHAVTQQ